MQLDNVFGNTQAKQHIKAALKAGSLAHGILLTGPDGCGRGFFARCLAADYLYPKGGPAVACVLNATSPELLLVEGEGRSGQIPVGRIRQVRQDVFQSALSSAGRVVLVKNAHTMAAPASNALLKVLEEPPKDVLFILTAKDASSLLPTILSRCALYPLIPLPFSECEKQLQKICPPNVTPHFPALLTTIYGGRLGLGLQVLQNPHRLSILQDALAIAHAAANNKQYNLFCLFAKYEGKTEEDRQNREALLSDIADILSACFYTLSTTGLPDISMQTAALLLPAISKTQLALKGNVAPKIAFSALAIQCKKALL